MAEAGASVLASDVIPIPLTRPLSHETAGVKEKRGGEPRSLCQEGQLPSLAHGSRLPRPRVSPTFWSPSDRRTRHRPRFRGVPAAPRLQAACSAPLWRVRSPGCPRYVRSRGLPGTTPTGVLTGLRRGRTAGNANVACPAAALVIGDAHPVRSNRLWRLRRVGRDGGSRRELGRLHDLHGRRQNFSIAIPDDWEIGSVDELLNEESADRLRQENPTLADAVDQLGDPRSVIKPIAYDLDANNGFATNFNVAVFALSGRCKRAAVLRPQRGAGRGRDRQSPRAGGTRASRRPPCAPRHVGDPWCRGSPVADQYLLFSPGRGYVLTYSALEERMDEYAHTFEQSAESFRYD